MDTTQENEVSVSSDKDGPSGIGKSTFIKHILETQYMLGKHCIIFDPEREYRDLCKNLGGSWWAAGGGGARVNLFQIFPVPPDDEEDTQFRTELRPVFQHVQRIKTIIRYMHPALTEEEMALLEDAIIIMYNNFGISITMSDTAIQALPAERFPIMSDLYRLLHSWEGKDPGYKKLALVLKSMAEGADSEIWNGHTNISLNNHLVVIDTKQLHDTTRENQVAQYYNLLTMAHSKVSEDLVTPYFVMADEAQTMLDPELPYAARSLKDMALRIRKREGCLWLAFHSLHELLDERIRMEGQSILDTAAYKIIFGTTGQNLVDTATLFRLTEAEQKILKQQKRGKALCIVGARHIQAEFILPEYKLTLMGRGGGR